MILYDANVAILLRDDDDAISTRITAQSMSPAISLVTINAADFRDIPGLALDIWPAPGQ